LPADRPPLQEDGAQVHAGRVEAGSQPGGAASGDDQVEVLSHCAYETLAFELGFRVLTVFELDAKAAPGGLAEDVVVRAADRAGSALHAVAEADQVLLLLLVPLVDAGRAEVVAVLARALVAADVLVGDLDVGMAGVLHV